MEHEYARVNERYVHLLAHFGLDVRIETADDAALPVCSIDEQDNVFTCVMNTAKIPAGEYCIYVGYHIRKILLPRLILETDRLILRRYRPEDAAQCFGFLSDEQDAYMDCRKAFTDMGAEYQERVALFGRRETQYMITLKESGEVVGTVYLFADDSRAVEAMEVGYSIACAHQRKGYAYEALSTLLYLLQDDLCLEMVTAGILPENTASKNLLLKLGFAKEGVHHKAVWHEVLDRPVDLVYYYRDRGGESL